MKKFKAAMFDFDGTVTAKGAYEPSKEMANALVELACRMPIAFCTGRQLESFLKHGYDSLVNRLSGDRLERFLSNLFLMGENGALGYFYSHYRKEFEEFYRSDWPEDFVGRARFMRELDVAVAEYGSVYHDAHRVVIVLRTNQHDLPYEERDIDEVYRLSDKLYEITMERLLLIDPDFEKYIHVGNSGIGVVISPAAGDKDTGIIKFAEFLGENRGLSFDAQAREIMVIGDRPQKSGNDHYFLRGEYGTPYTVGCLIDGADYPKPVIDKLGNRLLHDLGTLYMIENHC